MAHRLRGQERRDEGFVKLVAALEIINGVGLSFPKNANADEIEDHFTKVFAAPDPPVIENRHDHRAKLLQCVLADALEQLRAVRVSCALLRFFALFDGVVERLSEKVVSVAIKPRVLFMDHVKRFAKIEFLHGWRKPEEPFETRWHFAQQPLQ